RVQLRKSPGGGPPALLTRMSGFGQAFSAASRPAGVVMSPATSVTVTPGLALRISAAVFASASAPRAVSVTCTPSLASAIAQARPKPLLDAQTMARRPLMPRSTVSLPDIADGFCRRTLASPSGFGKGAGTHFPKFVDLWRASVRTSESGYQPNLIIRVPLSI